MKRKTNLLKICLTALLLVGCGNDTKKDNPSNDINENTNTDSDNKTTDDGGNTSGKEDGGNTSGKDDGGNTSEKEDKKDSPVITKETWDKTFSKKTLSNVKTTTKQSLYSLDEEILGVNVTMASEVESILSVDGKKSSYELVKQDSSYTVLDEEFDKFIQENTEMLEDFDNDKELAYKTYLNFLGLELEGEVTTTRNSSDNGYIVSEKLEKSLTNYFETTENPDITNLYKFQSDDDSYEKITLFTENCDKYNNGSIEEFDVLCELNGKFENAKYIAEKKCYQISYADLYKQDEKERYDLIPVEIYFNDDVLEKIIISTNNMEESMKFEYTFSNYGKTSVILPTEFKTCEHDLARYHNDDKYHYIVCDDCENLTKYDTHHFIDGECDVCQFVQCEFENVCNSAGERCGVFDKNVVTKEYVNGYVPNFDEYGYDNETNENVYTLHFENSDVRIVYTFAFDHPSDSTACYYYDVYTYSFFENNVKMHDDIVVKRKIYEHSYEIMDIGEVTEHPYSSDDIDSTIYRGTLQCKNCKKVVEDVDIYFAYGEEDYDYYSYLKFDYVNLNGLIKIDHDIDANTQKCTRCGLDFSEHD